MATNSGGRRRPQKYPDELRERAIRMVQEIRRAGGESHGVITRVARELGVGAESLRGWVNRAEIDSGNRPGPRRLMRNGSRISSGRTGSCAGRMTWRDQPVSATARPRLAALDRSTTEPAASTAGWRRSARGAPCRCLHESRRRRQGVSGTVGPSAAHRQPGNRRQEFGRRQARAWRYERRRRCPRRRRHGP